MTSFIKQLRGAALSCPDILIAKMARDIADEIAGYITALKLHASTEAMRELNAAWVRGVNILAKAQPTPDNSPRSGAGEVYQERMAA